MEESSASREQRPREPADTRGGPLWPDYRAYLSAGRLLIVVYGLVVMELGAWLAVRILPANLGDLRRVVSSQERVAQRTQKDSFLGFRLRPDIEIVYPSEGRQVSIRTTSLGLGDVGFRDLGASPPFDVVVLGDSFAYCDDTSPESCWLRLLGEKTGLSVAALGIPGYSTMQAARTLERYGSQLHPRIVLATAFASDIKDNELFDKWLQSGSDDYPKWRAGTRRKGVIGSTLARNSVVVRLALAARRISANQMENYEDGTLDLAFKFDRSWINIAKNVETSPGFALMQQALLAMEAEAEEIGAQLVVLLLPSKEEAYWHISRRYVDEDIDVDRPRRLIRAFCEGHGIKVCDFTDTLRAEARAGKQLYLRVSGHWNETGNALAADITEQCLREQKLLPVSAAQPTPADQAGSGG